MIQYNSSLGGLVIDGNNKPDKVQAEMPVPYPVFFNIQGVGMDLLKDNVGKLYRKFFIASFGSALIACIYGLVDMAMVGQYHGPDGSAEWR